MDTSIEIISIENESRIDSRIVAQGLGIRHNNFLNTLRKYQPELETLGILPFQTEVLSGPGQPPIYVMLNEDQVTFAVQLSRNTKEVVKFKLALTQAFTAAKKQISTQHIEINQLKTELRALTERFYSMNTIDYTEADHFEVLCFQWQRALRQHRELLSKRNPDYKELKATIEQGLSMLNELAPTLHKHVDMEEQILHLDFRYGNIFDTLRQELKRLK